MQAIEQRLERPLDEWLREEYVDKGRTTIDLAEELGVNTGSISRWLAHFGIPARLYGPRKKTPAVA